MGVESDTVAARLALRPSPVAGCLIGKGARPFTILGARDRDVLLPRYLSAFLRDRRDFFISPGILLLLDNAGLFFRRADGRDGEPARNGAPQGRPVTAVFPFAPVHPVSIIFFEGNNENGIDNGLIVLPVVL